ncbi:Fanconi anemia group D2 protein homolog [Ochlerotatus camptorhynchus]|uniref:Fanconi anemia group D2 protein homolog n=1 Tax=Ochlerotatus camptorhynchus TaxID=644619 RepID=UPI0031D1EB08
MFKNRKSTLLVKKSSDLTTIRETVSDATASPSQKVRRLESGAEPTETDDPFGSSQFSVPASQMNSQRRYLSQRSNLQKSQSARTSRRIPTNYFESVLLKCQLGLDDPTSIVLKCEPITFVRTLRSMLQGSPDYPRNVKDFLHGVEQVSKTRDGFRKMLECCQMQNQTSGELKLIQESVVKMLLCVEFMQEDLIRLLFEYVERVAEEEVGVNMIRLVLSQIKFIDHTVHGTLVFNKYFEVLERSKNVQLLREAVGSLEDVIDVAKQDMAFRKLMELFPRVRDLFTVMNVTVFCEMSLSGSTLRLTRQKMVEFVESGCPVEIYPVLVRFMLKFNSSEIDGLHENIQEIRQVVDGLVRLSSGEKYLRECFQIIYQALTVSAVLYEAWIKFCRLLMDEESHMAFDLLVLVMMLTVNEIKSGTIEKILLNKIKKRHLSISHMKELTKQFGCVLTVHMDCVLDFVESCLKERHTEVCEFGVLSMSYLFSANNMNNRLVLNKLVGFMSEMALINEGHRNDHLISICMNALSSIYNSYPNDIRNNAHILLKIMDISMDLNLQQYRTVVSLICEAIHVPDRPIGDNETWDSLNIVIKKQLLSTSKDVKKKGIIGVVRLIRHLLITCTGNDELPCSFDSEKTIDTVSGIPTISGREIGNMINLLFTSSNESTDVLALCYDELAEMLQDFERNVGKPEKAFTIWLCDVLTNEFQNFFIIEEVPQGDVVQFTKKLCINDTADVENTNAEAYAISVNIAENMLAYNSRYSSMCFFLAMFKLMKALQMIRYDGNLESINALLGCAIVVPSFYDEPDEKHLVETFEEDVCRQLLDAYFYIANWFRELINAFIHQTDPLLHRKVLQRLSALVQLERRLAAMLRTVDFDYYPPICDFSAGTQSMSSRAAKESSSKQNITLNATKTQLDTTVKPRSSISSEFDGETLFSRHRHGFRTMDNQVIQLFREAVLLCHDLPENKVGECLGLTEYRFLLETFTIEVESKADPRAKQHLDIKLNDLITALPFAVDNYITIKAKRKELHVSTVPDSQTEYKALTCCSNLSLRLFTGILLLLKATPNDLRDNALKAFVKLAISDAPDKDAAERILTSELTHKNAFKDLHNAHCLFKFGLALNSVFPAPNNPSIIAAFCQKFICSHFTPKTGTVTQLSQLLQGLFTVVDFSKIKRLTKALADDLTSSKTDEKLFSGLQRTHYSLLFKELTKSFIKCIQTELRTRRTTIQKFVLWEQSSEILKQFSEVAKQADNLKIYSYYMKYSHTYLKLFQQSGLKTLEDVLKVSADRVSHLLSSLQHGTRYLHNICCHTKNIKDNSLAAQIPFIRETVETLIYSVKALLAANDCASVFWMGNLKNKDLKGDLIISQNDEAENDLEQESEESDIEDFLSDDQEDNRPAAAAALGKSGSGAKSSQSKCF